MAGYVNNTVQRMQIADYLNVTPTAETESWEFMGEGFTALDENPNAQSKKKRYINNASESSITTGYQAQFPFNADFIASESVIKFLYGVARNQKTGGEAETEYLRIELFESPLEQNIFPARKFRVSVEISSVKDTDGSLELSGNLNNVGSFVDGKFNTLTKTFTPLSEAQTPAVKSAKT